MYLCFYKQVAFSVLCEDPQADLRIQVRFLSQNCSFLSEDPFPKFLLSVDLLWMGIAGVFREKF